MYHFGRIEIFLEVAKHQSFAKAAKALGITGPAASKQVMALEDSLGVKLLHRTTRLVTLTDDGAIYYDRARLALDELREAAAEVQDRKSAPKGTLRINVPLSFGQQHLLPVISSFAKKYPDLAVEASLDDRMVDVVADGYDIVIRIGVQIDSTLVTRQLAMCPLMLVASPAYLREHGTPATPAEMKAHRTIAYTNLGGTSEWKYKDKQGKTGIFRSEGIFRSNNAEMMLQAALDGVGMVVLPYFCVVNHVKAGTLVHVLPEYETTPPRQIVALMPPNRYRSTKVKLFLDWMVQACKAMPLSECAEAITSGTKR